MCFFPLYILDCFFFFFFKARHYQNQVVSPNSLIRHGDDINTKFKEVKTETQVFRIGFLDNDKSYLMFFILDKVHESVQVLILLIFKIKMPECILFNVCLDL